MKKNISLLLAFVVAMSAILSSRTSAEASQFPETQSTANLKIIHFLIAGGVQTSSKTLYNKNGIRIDVENPAPDKRPGQVHLQTGQEKYIYDPTTGLFKTAPPKIQKLLADPEIAAAVQKGIEKYLEIVPWKP